MTDDADDTGYPVEPVEPDAPPRGDETPFTAPELEEIGKGHYPPDGGERDE